MLGGNRFERVCLAGAEERLAIGRPDLDAFFGEQPAHRIAEDSLSITCRTTFPRSGLNR